MGEEKEGRPGSPGLAGASSLAARTVKGAAGGDQPLLAVQAQLLRGVEGQLFSLGELKASSLGKRSPAAPAGWSKFGFRGRAYMAPSDSLQ